MNEQQEDQLRVAAKRELRKRMKSVREATPRAAIATRSEAIAASVLALPQWQSARCVALFSAMEKEVQTASLIAAARAQGKRVVLPRVVDGEALLAWHAPYDAGDAELVRSLYGIAEPAASSPRVDEAEIDLAIIPALALDERGNRLGYGAGYYDRALPRMTKAYRVGVVFSFSMLVEVPTRSDDAPVQWLITDKRSCAAE